MRDNTRRTIWILRLALKRGGWKRAEYIRKHNIFHNMGSNCYYHPIRLPAEPHLVSFGNNVFIGTDVKLITHDMSNCVFNNSGEIKKRLIPFVDRIIIGNNVFIGAGAVILPGVEIEDNCVVAAGTVVTKKVDANSILAGIPAKKIGTYEEHKRKIIEYNDSFQNATMQFHNLSLWRKQEKFFWNL